MSFAGIKSLSYMVQRLSNVSRRKIRLTTQNLTSAKGGAQVVVEFPLALLDLATFTMYAKVTIADGAQFTTVVNAEHLIESYYLESGGQILTQPFKFNDLVHILESYQMGDRLNVRRALQILAPAPASPKSHFDGCFCLVSQNLD
jgi:stress response protein SCP2